MTTYENELYHHGILGQKWGVRRYQNKDGSYTAAGKKRYGSGEKMDASDPRDSKVTRRVKSDYNNLSDEDFRKKYAGSKETYRKRVNRYGDPYMNSPLAKLGKKLGEKTADEEETARKKRYAEEEKAWREARAKATEAELKLYAMRKSGKGTDEEYNALQKEVFRLDAIEKEKAKAWDDAIGSANREGPEKKKGSKKSKPIKEINNQLSHYESPGRHFVNQNHIMQTQMEQARWASEQATRAAINASLQGASLSMSGGTNPFMFGMM